MWKDKSLACDASTGDAVCNVNNRRAPTHLVQRPWRRRLSGLAADEKERRRFLTAAKQVGQVLVRAGQEKPLLLQTAERM